MQTILRFYSHRFCLNHRLWYTHDFTAVATSTFFTAQIRIFLLRRSYVLEGIQIGPRASLENQSLLWSFEQGYKV